MRLLGLDIGMRRTGVAYFEDATGIVLPLQTITTGDPAVLVKSIQDLCEARRIDRLVIGLPRLPSGEEGEQAEFVRSIGDLLSSSLPLSYIDERYTSVPMRQKGEKASSTSETDSWAACQILTMYTERQAGKDD